MTGKYQWEGGGHHFTSRLPESGCLTFLGTTKNWFKRKKKQGLVLITAIRIESGQTPQNINKDKRGQPVGMIDKKSVNMLWIGIRNIELRSRTIRNANFPQCGPISWRLMHEIAHFNTRTCITGYRNIKICMSKKHEVFKRIKQFWKFHGISRKWYRGLWWWEHRVGNLRWNQGPMHRGYSHQYVRF